MNNIHGVLFLKKHNDGSTYKSVNRFVLLDKFLDNVHNVGIFQCYISEELKQHELYDFVFENENTGESTESKTYLVINCFGYSIYYIMEVIDGSSLYAPCISGEEIDWIICNFDEKLHVDISQVMQLIESMNLDKYRYIIDIRQKMCSLDNTSEFKVVYNVGPDKYMSKDSIITMLNRYVAMSGKNRKDS